MTTPTPSQRPRHRVLVVDDEIKIAELFQAVLKSRHDADIAICVREAFAALDKGSYDIVVTDLKLPDGDGLEILRRAKQLDQYTEVIIITGYASVETATQAVNLGATSYLTKPVSMSAFSAQVDRAIANRDFHLRSRQLIKSTEGFAPSVKQHLWNITTIYSLSQKLMLSLDISEIMHMLLEELNDKMNSAASLVGVSIFGESEVFAMPQKGSWDAQTIHTLLNAHWDALFGMLDQKEFVSDKVSLLPFEGKPGAGTVPADLQPVVVPMIAMGRNIGTIAVFRPRDTELPEEAHQFLHVFSSLVSPLVENGYVHKRTMSQAVTDALTGIANHRSFQEMLSREIARADREKSEFCMVMIDVDDFKKVNDTYGHLIGDAILKQLTHTVNEAVRTGDIFARYGGEEFALILPCTDLEGAFSLAERIRKEIAGHPYAFYEKSIPFTVSLGISLYSGKTPRSKEQLVRDSDDALYVSKAEGKNRITAR